jgi:hypothetical protein
MFTDVKKEKRKKTFDVTILTEVVIGISIISSTLIEII